MIVFEKLGNYGRLGNQMFQIASTIGIAKKNNTDYAFPEWSVSKHFDGEFPIMPTTSFQTYKEPNPYYSDVILDSRYNWSLEGYFQSWKYFEHCKDLVLSTFHFDREPVDAIALHVRRGDYLNLQHVHPVLQMNYYKSAMEYFQGENFTVFSDDIEWCKDNLSQRNVTYSTTYNLSPIEDFKHMASHKGFITANSSFSWWAAYLSGSEEVIAPKHYVIGETKDDRLLSDWIKI